VSPVLLNAWTLRWTSASPARTLAAMPHAEPQHRAWIRALLTQVVLGVLGVIGSAIASAAPPAQHAHRAPATSPCRRLEGRTIGGALIEHATPDTAPAGAPGGCTVLASLHRTLHFRLTLPAQWNHRLLYGGGGGWDGSIPTLAYAPAEELAPYATVASDGGHSGTALDATWALRDPQARIDFAFLSVHSVLEAARALLQEYYGSDAEHRYFEGCSNGGREALIEAARYPDDFEGIIARAPAYSWTGLFAAFVRNAQRLYGTAAGGITADSARLIEQAALAQCDRLDGLEDGLISNPLGCQLHLEALRCAAGAQSGCLTAEQLRTVQIIDSELRAADGTVVYPAWGPGGEEHGWVPWLIAPAAAGSPPSRAPLPDRGLQTLFAEGFVRYWLTEDPHADVLHFEPTQHAVALDLAGAMLNASPDLGGFFALGHKLILWHGTADWAISFRGSIEYFREVAQAVGGESRRDQSMELYLAPGVQHCAGGAGADSVDLLGPLKDWVESGHRPSEHTLIATKRAESGRILMSRPLCRYPSYPKYDGGDPGAADSFSCVAH
jgi:hypothetical protein